MTSTLKKSNVLISTFIHQMLKELIITLDKINIRKRMSFVFQNYNLIITKTALQNVMEPLIVVQKKSKVKSNSRRSFG
jgi:ABC-type polar amino acid transport system ATPase subunit